MWEKESGSTNKQEVAGKGRVCGTLLPQQPKAMVSLQGFVLSQRACLAEHGYISPIIRQGRNLNWQEKMAFQRIYLQYFSSTDLGLDTLLHV